MFALDGEDVVLGIGWLEGLGDMKTNFKGLTLKIKKGEAKYIFRGDPTICKGEVLARSIVRELQGEREGFIIECLLHQAEQEMVKGVPNVVEEILKEFDDMFHNPQGLLTKMRHDHATVLKEGAVIPNLRPYRYPYSHKDEIEKLIDDMLKGGIIRPSNSP